MCGRTLWTSVSFRPLAGLSCINRGSSGQGSSSLSEPFPSPRGVELHKPLLFTSLLMTPWVSSFRPLAGLSCINRVLASAPAACRAARFRPLAGLSCINLAISLRDIARSSVKFPSPRGVELHKPCTDYDTYVCAQDVFPSPRGVELHKPIAWALVDDADVIEFPSPRGVELHKPYRSSSS